MATSFLKKRFDATKLPALKKQAYKQLIAVPAFKKEYAADSRKQDFLAKGGGRSRTYYDNDSLY
jgi:hypothetical protein